MKAIDINKNNTEVYMKSLDFMAILKPLIKIIMREPAPMMPDDNHAPRN